MKDLRKDCRLALVQAEPVMFDKKASLEKALAYIDEAAANGAELIVFPELFIPGYPIGVNDPARFIESGEACQKKISLIEKPES